MDQQTDWYLKLKDFVSAPLQKVMQYATETQKKIKSVDGGMEHLSKTANVMGRDFKRSYSQLNDLLGDLKKRQAEAFDTKHILAYQKMIDKTRKEMERFNSVSNPVQKQTKWQSFKGNLGGLANQMPGAGGMLGSMAGLATNPYTLVAGAALMIGTASTKLALDYQTGMAKINATAQLPAETLAKLKDRLKEIGSSSGGNFELMPSAYEKILSQTGNVNQSLNILETAVKGAKAGFTDIDTVAASLGRSMSAIGDPTVTSDSVLDVLLKGKAVGAGELNDFAQYGPSLMALGKSVGVGWKDAIGLFSVMTANGNDAAKSATLVENAFSALGKKDVLKGLEGYGINAFYKNGDKKGMRRNIVDIIKDMSKYMQGITDEQKTKFLLDINMNDIQAKQAFESLITDGKKFESIMGGVNNAVGEANKQLAMTPNLARDWGDISDEFKNLGETIGTVLIPVLDLLITGFNEFFKGIGKLFSKDFWSNFFGGDDAYKSTVIELQRKVINKSTIESVDKKFGAYKPGENSNLTKERNQAYVNVNEELTKAFKKGNSNNNIVKDNKPKTPAELLAEANGKNNPDPKGNGNSEKSGTSVLGGGGNGGKNLTMNLHITNHIHAAKDGIDNFKRKLTDAITDAGRDSLVTLGT